MLIDLQHLINKYKFSIKGIIHIGASTGQEMPAYAAQTDGPVIFIEAIPEVYRELVQKMKPYPQASCLHACISDVDGDMVNFNVSNNEGQSSSLFEFGTHTLEHPGVVFTKKIRLQTTTVRTLFAGKGVNPEQYDFLNIDLQGAELMALKSMDLTHINYAYLEVNEKPLYYQCPLLPEMDQYMKEKGFTRAETKMTAHGWGDAFYMRVREKNLPVHVPSHFQPHQPSNYPTDNVTDFEHWYLLNYSPHAGRLYLPVMWTAYYCRKKYGKDQGAIDSLQQFLRSLDRTKKYYTIVQYDDGILNDLSMLDIKVYSMSGKPMDHPLPLICQPHEALPPVERTIFASFVGRKTHAIREQLDQFKDRSSWYISDRQISLPRYCEILNKSIFTLCPRGYGPTSFRIMEALQFGSIPVYISDEFIEAHNVDFDTYGIAVLPCYINDLPDILAQANISELQAAGKLAYELYYTYQANKEIIDNTCTLP